MDLALRRGRQQAAPAVSDDEPSDSRIGDEISRMLSMIRLPEESRASGSSRGGEAPDWSASLGLAEKVTKALRLSSERAQKLEERVQGVIQRASEELENAHKQIGTLEARLRATEAREKQLEARAREAEQWLQRIHDTLAEELTSSLGRYPEMGAGIDGGDPQKTAQPAR